MRYVSNKLKITGLVMVALAQTACSLSSRSTHHVVISMPEGGFKASVSRVQAHARTSNGGGGGGGDSFPMPSSLADFKCIGVMITGEGVFPSAGLDEQCTANPAAMPRGLGKLVGLVPASGGSIDVEVPGGPARLLQLVGVQSKGECPDLATILNQTEEEHQAGPKLGEPFSIGSVEADIFADQSIEIKAVFDPLNALPMFSCHDDNGGGGGVPTLGDLDLYPHGTTNAGFRVNGYIYGPVNQIGLFSDSACTSQITTNQHNYSYGMFSVTAPSGVVSSSVYLQASGNGSATECALAGNYSHNPAASHVLMNDPKPGFQAVQGASGVMVNGACTGSGTINAFIDGAAAGTCACAAGFISACTVPLAGIADGFSLLELQYTANGYTVDDGVLFEIDSLAPNFAITSPAGAMAVSGAAVSSFVMGGTCGSNGTGNVVVSTHASNSYVQLAAADCTGGSWSTTSPAIDLSGIPDGNIHLDAEHFNTATPTHRTHASINVFKGAGGATGGTGGSTAPTVTAVSPTGGQVYGGNPITIYGTNFVSPGMGGAVTIGGYSCVGYTHSSATQVSCTTPFNLPPGNYSVIVTGTATQQSDGSVMYSYSGTMPAVTMLSFNTAPVTGGTGLIITGFNFVAGASVTIGGVACGNLTVNNASSITCDPGSGATPGTYLVIVTNPNAETSLNGPTFTYY